MKQEGQFLLFKREEFEKWLFGREFKKPRKLLQNHHTYKPDYSDFNGNNHFQLLNSMKNYHMRSAHFSDIAQNLTTFNDGTIAVCRDFDTDPAGIFGANAKALCMEHVGNFDTEKMTEEHKKTIIFLNAILCKRFNITPDTQGIVYHHWYDLTTGKRTNGEGNTKTCPGRGFFGGNTLEAAEMNFIPLVKEMLGGKCNCKSELELLQSQKVISSINYWIENAVPNQKVKGEYVRVLISNFLAIKQKNMLTFKDGVSYLAEVGVVNKPEYWLTHAAAGESINGEYAGALIKRMAEKLK